MNHVATHTNSASRLWWLLGLSGFAIAMMLFFLFGYSMFYGLWCKLTGTQISPNNPPSAAAPLPVANGTAAREIEVFFESKAYDNLPVRFYASEPRVMAKIGVDTHVTYRFKNLSEQSVHFRPIHQVSPLIAGQHFSMKMCFCFTDQTIGPGQSAEFPVIFSFDDQMDPRVTTVSVRYSLHRINDGEAQSEQQKRVQAELEAAGAHLGGAKIMTPGFEGLSLPKAPVTPTPSVVPIPYAPPASLPLPASAQPLVPAPTP
jgi:cytochrome c oxidase assembly protein subunit 11